MDASGAKALAEKSGNGLQCRVASHFRSAEWAVLLSPYYVDLTTDKTRESDLIVERAFSVPVVFVGVPPESIRLRLFIECKYVPPKDGGVVFWMGEKDRPQTEKWVQQHTPFFRDHISFSEHHYIKGNEPVAKLFTSERGSGDEADPFFRAINQCLNNFIHNAKRESLWSRRTQNEQVTKLDYPVLICSDFRQFFSTSAATLADPVPLACSAFQVELNYAYVNAEGAKSQGYFLVDVVDFSRIDSFVSTLLSEAEAAKNLRALT